MSQTPEEGYYPQAGKGKAIASLVLGICSIVFCWFPVLGLIVGVVGLILAASSKREGYLGGMRTGGLVCSIIGTVFSALYTACVIAGLAMISTMPDWMLY
jgi:hypothetical protein